MESSRWRWHLDAMFVKINGERHYRRAVDHDGEVLESFDTKTRDREGRWRRRGRWPRQFAERRGVRTVSASCSPDC